VDKTLLDQQFDDEQPTSTETTQTLAERGVPEAQFSLGIKFAHGINGIPDFVTAASWYLKAANQNHSLAQFNLGQMYAVGQGLPCDPVLSLHWFQKAADQGDAGAQFSLGQTHQRASLHGTPAENTAERIIAYKWFRLAAEQGYAGSQAACDVINMKMSREDLAEGGRGVTGFNTAKIPVA
jgi:TPR repeat protein